MYSYLQKAGCIALNLYLRREGNDMDKFKVTYLYARLRYLVHKLESWDHVAE